MKPTDPAKALGDLVMDAIAGLITNRDVHFAGIPVDVMLDSGMQRAFVVVTVHEALIPGLEAGLQAAIAAKKSHGEGGAAG